MDSIQGYLQLEHDNLVSMINALVALKRDKLNSEFQTAWGKCEFSFRRHSRMEDDILNPQYLTAFKNSADPNWTKYNSSILAFEKTLEELFSSSPTEENLTAFLSSFVAHNKMEENHLASKLDATLTTPERAKLLSQLRAEPATKLKSSSPPPLSHAELGQKTTTSPR